MFISYIYTSYLDEFLFFADIHLVTTFFAWHHVKKIVVSLFVGAKLLYSQHFHFHESTLRELLYCNSRTGWEWI